MPMRPQRRTVHFASAGTDCAAWHYPGRNDGNNQDEYFAGGEPGVIVRRSPRDRVKEEKVK